MLNVVKKFQRHYPATAILLAVSVVALIYGAGFLLWLYR